MPNVDRYPTWILLLAAIALAVAVVLRYLILDRRSNPRRLWLMLLAAWLTVIGLARAGIFVTRSGRIVTPNEGLLVIADLMAGMLVISIPVGRATRRLADDDLRRIRRRDALSALLHRRGAFAVMALMVGTMAALLVGEIALAAELPGPPAVVACDDYTTWILAPANGTLPPRADQGILTKASQVAPPGRLRLDLAALVVDVRSAIFDSGTTQGVLDETRIVSDEDAVYRDCRSVPAPASGGPEG